MAMLTNKGKTAGAVEAAGYISSLASELREIALKNDLGFVAYLLAMAADEAKAVAGGRKHQAEPDAA